MGVFSAIFTEEKIKSRTGEELGSTSSRDMTHLIATPAFTPWQHCLWGKKMCGLWLHNSRGGRSPARGWERGPGGRWHTGPVKKGRLPTSSSNTAPHGLALHWFPTPGSIVRDTLCPCRSPLSVWPCLFDSRLAPGFSAYLLSKATISVPPHRGPWALMLSTAFP